MKIKEKIKLVKYHRINDNRSLNPWGFCNAHAAHTKENFQRF